MEIVVSVSRKNCNDAPESFSWPADAHLIVPREGEYADFSGDEARLVRRVTYHYELVQAVPKELIRLTVQIQTL
jgi:hypothetical protein